MTSYYGYKTGISAFGTTNSIKLLMINNMVFNIGRLNFCEKDRGKVWKEHMERTMNEE